jgi:uncharacterized protein (DUF1330 family)
MQMARGYWIAHVDVTDPDTYKEYVRLNGIAFAKYGAKFVVRGGAAEVKSGTARARHVIIEFESFAVAKACYESAEYQAAAKVRDTCSTADLVIVEGVEA